VKRARYAAELAAPELGKRGRDFVEAAKRLQEVLGEHQDAAVAEERVRAWAGRGSGRDAAVPLVERERQRKAAARAAWPAAWDGLRRAAKQLT
jgi:CHAD domain-containing protein